jgi:hypothetical protein
MFAVVQNGEFRQVIQPDTAFMVGDKQYSARFLRNATEEERKAAGVYEIIYEEQKDQRFYWVDGPHYTVNQANQTVYAAYNSTAKELEDRLETKEDGTPLYVQTYDPTADNGKGAMVDTTEQVVTKGLKSNWIAQVKQTAGSLLAQTDWMVIRKAERNVDIPASVVTKRAAIVAECDRLEAAITATQNVGQLQTVVMNQQWPNDRS